ncbi:hypothetical protein CBS63078_10939 [Aspergillus niger]|nr:hypothetical protein CBS63078_10939 [Aspergillus niger]
MNIRVSHQVFLKHIDLPLGTYFTERLSSEIAKMFYNIERDVRDTRDVITPAHCCSASGLSYDSFTDFKIPAC